MYTGERNAEHLPRALKRIRYSLIGGRTRAWLASAPIRPTAVILYSGYTPYLMQLRGLCRARGIPFIFDAVEWYSAATIPGFLASPYLWNTELAMRVLIPRLDGRGGPQFLDRLAKWEAGYASGMESL